MTSTETAKYTRKEVNAGVESLRRNPYPGRGIVMGFSEDGKRLIQVYWMTARSDPSKNRVLVMDSKGTVKTNVANPDQPSGDPKNLIYTAAFQLDSIHVVGNGRQTGGVLRALRHSESIEEELKRWSFEKDSESTPRIMGLVKIQQSPYLTFSLIKRSSSGKPMRTIWDYDEYDIQAGTGLCIHTYKTDGKPAPSFEGAPYPVLLEGKIRDIAKTFWGLLGPREKDTPDNRISMLVKAIDIRSGEVGWYLENALGDTTSSAPFGF